MQGFIDEEKVIINGSYVRPLVISARIQVRGRSDLSSATFVVEMRYRPVAGTNVYENFYEPDVAEYDYDVYWVMPPGGRVKSFELSGETSVSGDGRVLSARVRSGTRVKGYESVAFELGSTNA